MAPAIPIIQLLSCVLVYAVYVAHGCVFSPSLIAFVGLFLANFTYFTWRGLVNRFLFVPGPIRKIWIEYRLQEKIDNLPSPIRWVLNKTGIMSIIAWISAHCLNLAYDFDIWVFSVVSYAVYFWLTRVGRKKKLEGVETFSKWTFWQMISSGLKVGAIVAGLMDLGVSILPKDYAAASVVADLLKCIADFLRASKDALEVGDHDSDNEGDDKDHKIDTEPIQPPKQARSGWMATYWNMAGQRAAEAQREKENQVKKALNELPLEKDGDEKDDDDDLEALWTWTSKLRELREQVKTVLVKHKARFAWFFAAVITGVVIYCYRKHSAALEKVLEGTQKGQKGANSGKKYKARGKNAHRHNGPTRQVTGNKSYWTYYEPDVKTIVDVFLNDEPISRSRISSGQALEPGHWQVFRQVGKTIVEDDFTVGGTRRRNVGDDDDLKAMAARRNGGKAPMTISGKRAKELGFEAVSIDPVHTSMICFHVGDCKLGVTDPLDDDCDGCVDLWQFVFVATQDGPIKTEPHSNPALRSMGFCEQTEPTEPVEPKKAPSKPLPAIPKKTPPPVPPKPIRPKPSEELVIQDCELSFNETAPELKGHPDAKSKAAKEKTEKQRKINQPLEALVASSPKVDIHNALFRIELLDENEKYLSSGTVLWCGIICNHHAYTAAKYFRCNGKKIVKTKAVQLSSNKDMMIAQFFDGCPKPIAKKHVEKPEVSSAVMLVDQNSKVCRGVVQSVDEIGTHGLQARATYSSEPGDCGCCVLNLNGSVVGIHFSAGRTGYDNLFFPVNDELLAYVPKNSYNPSPRDA